MQDEQADTRNVQTEAEDGQTEAEGNQAQAHDVPAKPRKSLARRLLPILALLLLVALAFDAATLRDMLRKSAPAPGRGGSQGSASSLASPDEVNALLAKLGQKWDKPGPPVLMFDRPG